MIYYHDMSYLGRHQTWRQLRFFLFYLLRLYNTNAGGYGPMFMSYILWFVVLKMIVHWMFSGKFTGCPVVAHL